MASVEGEKDEMDSLFEGMVLFNPSQVPVAADHDDDDDDDDDDDHTHQQQQEQEQQHQSDTSSASTSQPLDENLFSDLTLITPLQVEAQPDDSDTPPAEAATIDSNAYRSNREALPSSISRQFSNRKKKRAAALRIGYGRDASIPDSPGDDARSLEPELPPPSLPLPSELESESTGSGPQRHEQSVSHPSPPTNTAENTCEEAVYSPSSSAANGAFSRDDDNFASDAQDTDLQTGDDGVNEATTVPIELRFELIRTQISQKLEDVRELVASVSTARKESTRRRRATAESVNLASTRYRELEKELEDACEAEDFEAAERISESLASAEKEKERLVIGLRHAEADCVAVDSKMQEVLQSQIAAEEECASMLKNFARDATNDADLVLKNAESACEKELDEWLSYTEDLELKKMELDIESQLVNAARLAMKGSIDHLVEDDRRERELLCERKETLIEELNKLLALVKAKEAEIAETDYSIETIEKRIEDVVSSFQEVQSSVDTKYGNLQSRFSQMELDNEDLIRKKKEIDDFLSLEKDRRTKLQKLVQISADEGNMYQEVVELRKSLVQSIVKSTEDKLRLAKTEEKLSEDVNILRQEISAARASLQELSSAKSSIQQEIESLKQRLVFIDKRVPELEAEKKVAAAARNFKEAARIASESKTLNVEKEGLQIKMNGGVLELGKLEEEISDTVSRLQETEGQISTKEKELAMARFQRLLLIAGAAKAERSAALELGDQEEADILLAEAEAAESEARKIQPVYDFKDEDFTNIPKQHISMELVSNLGQKPLAELAASAQMGTT